MGVFDKVFDFLGFPSSDFVVVADDAGACFEFGFHFCFDFFVGAGCEVKVNDIGVGEVDFEEVAIYDGYAVGEVVILDDCGGAFGEVFAHFYADGFGAEGFGGHNYGASVSCAEVKEVFAGFKFGKFNHAAHDGDGTWDERGDEHVFSP